MSYISELNFDAYNIYKIRTVNTFNVQVLYDMFEVYSEIGEENLTIYDIIKGFISFFVVAGGGTLIGVIWGYITGFVTRFTSHARILEPLFVFTMAYLSYLTAEIFKMSGILA